ncbi:MAG: hypothetical protein ACR5KW_03985 [Wolbachia sp.]
MSNKLKKKQNTFAQKIHDTYDNNIRKTICITTCLTMLLCKISPQFCCEFIDNIKSNILLIQNIAQWAKFMTSILYITYSAFNLYDLIKDYRDLKNKKELAKIVSKSATFVSSTIEALMMLKIIHLLIRNANVISYVHLTSTILFLFISEPIAIIIHTKNIKRHIKNIKMHVKNIKIKKKLINLQNVKLSLSNARKASSSTY